jgi:hypothetical protein
MQYTFFPAWSLRALVLGVVLALAGCTAALTSHYDAELVSGANTANEQALIFFSEVSGGSSAARFAALSPSYDEIIGKFDALRIRATARDVPPMGQQIAARLCPDDPDPATCANASPGSLQTIVHNQHRPHSAIGYATPAAYAAQLTAMGDRLRVTEALRQSPIAPSAQGASLTVGLQLQPDERRGSQQDFEIERWENG